jgi:hypothetical protein
MLKSHGRFMGRIASLSSKLYLSFYLFFPRNCRFLPCPTKSRLTNVPSNRKVLRCNIGLRTDNLDWCILFSLIRSGACQNSTLLSAMTTSSRILTYLLFIIILSSSKLINRLFDCLKSKSKLPYDWRLTANHFILVLSPSMLTNRDFFPNWTLAVIVLM